MSELTVADLKIKPREGYARGQEGFEQILRAALSLLVEEGSKALTLRRIAAKCGLKAGNLAYYFKSKNDLLHELLNAVLAAYEEPVNAIVHDSGASAAERLEGVVNLIMDDITSKKTTRIFPELWALANHDPFVHERMQEFYRRSRIPVEELIAEMNPALPTEERAMLALFIGASIEGMTIFAGHQKPWHNEMPAFKHLAAKSFVHMIRTLRPGEIGGKTRLPDTAAAARQRTTRQARSTASKPSRRKPAAR